ncbi:hypothetical protein ACO3TA_05410 [Methanocaldococcus sp. 28A]
MKKNIDSVFVSALYYGINKAISDIVGTASMVIGRRASEEIIKLLKEIGLLHDNMTKEDIINLFVNTFGLSEDLIIEEKDDKVIFTIVKPTLDLFLKKLMEENSAPYVCPYIYLLSNIYEINKEYKLMLHEIIPQSDQVKLIFKKIKK